MNKWLPLGMAATTVALAAGLAAAPSAGAADTAQVSVIHGIPKTPVNVFVDGKSALSGFKPGTVAGPLALPAGSHTVTIFPASNTAGTGTPVIKASASLEAGRNYSLVAHLTADGKPTLTPFANDVSAVPAGQARLVVRHTAAAPAVDVRANGQVAFGNLTNPNEAKADLPAGTISADVVLAGTSQRALGPADLTLKEGTSTIVYATGSATDKTLSLATQSISGLHSAPGGVPAGIGGLADSETGTPGWAWASAGAFLLAALAGGAGLYRTVRRAAPVRG